MLRMKQALLSRDSANGLSAVVAIDANDACPAELCFYQRACAPTRHSKEQRTVAACSMTVSQLREYFWTKWSCFELQPAPVRMQLQDCSVLSKGIQSNKGGGLRAGVQRTQCPTHNPSFTLFYFFEGDRGALAKES